MIDWNPDLYLKFGKERTLPSKDLVSRIGINNPARILDIGCGSGNSTNELKKRWPDAEIIGIDNSPTMIEKAKALYTDIDFRLMDATEDLSNLGTFDIVFSNAAIQRMTGHEELIKKWYALLNTGGTIAIQLPLVDSIKGQQALYELEYVKKYKPYFEGKKLRFNHHQPDFYYDVLSRLSSAKDIQIWTTTYMHVMQGLEGILQWYESTSMKDYLDALPNDEYRENFKNNYLIKLKNVYSLRADGTVLFNYKRLFVVASKSK